jgi:tetratricopeptide (TPR) repeat protein
VHLHAQVNTDSLQKARQQKLDSARAAQQRYNDSMKVARERILDSTRTAQKRYNDSVATARARILDSTRTAQKNYFDSLRIVREARMDSIKAERERVSDSLAAIRAYKQSKHYKDSIATARQARLDSIQLARQVKLNSIKAERQRITDSTVAARKAYVDSIKIVQKRRSDSLGAIRAYKESKRYKDSVAVVRKMRSDSIKAVRTAYYDSISTERKRVNDSIAAVRQAYTDSITTARKIYTDSLKEARKIRTDSLAKLKAKREKDKEVRAKNREEKAQLALELKIKKKREAYNNDQMLKKRWGFPRSVLQNTFTRFNYYFNADQKMDEALENMQRFRRENYDSLLALFPFNPDRDSSVLAPDMDSIIQKASLGIQIHDPRTKWGDDLYLLLGQAYYYKGDYKNASDAFKYIVSLRDKKKKKRTSGKSSVVQEEKSGISKLLTHKSVHNEGILWLSRVLTQQQKEGDAESILDLVETDPNFPGSLSGRVALEKSFIRLNQEDYRGAMAPLDEVSKDTKLPDWIRIRAAYINGQLQQRYENYTASAESFNRVLDMHPNIEMDFYAKKNMATSLMMAGGEQGEAVAVLKKILKDGKYVQYYEQVYYLLGRLSLNGGSTEEAIAYLQDGIDAPKTTGAQKAVSYATLGDIYYDQRKYQYAKNAYDSASIYMNDAPDSDLMSTALRRSVALSKLTGPLDTIRNNDSLLHLATLDEREQRSIVRKYIKMLEDKRADSIFQAENAGLTAAMKNAGNNNTNNKNNYANWYFSNPALMQKGYNDFKQKWGNRPMTDNWRRSSAGGFARNDNGDGGDGDENSGVDANGLPTEEALMAAIPKDEKSKEQALADIRKAYVSAATAYITALEDYPPAINLLDTLDRRFPKHEYDAEVLYLRYMAAIKQSRFEEAKQYSARLLSEYPDSKWAKLVQPTEDGQGLDAAEGVVAYYDRTYNTLLNHEYELAAPMARTGREKYNVPVYTERFQLIETIALAMMGEFVVADSLLSAFMTKHTDPNDSLRRWAEAVQKYIGDNKSKLPPTPPVQIAPPSSGTTFVDTSAAGNVPSAKVPDMPAKTPVAYSYNPAEEHLVIFTFKNMEQRTKGVQVAIEDFNKFKFGSLNLQTEVNMLNATDGIIAVKSFTNKNQAVIYMNSLKKTAQIFREYQSGEYDIMMISAPNFNKLVADKDIQAYSRFYKSKY